jgi:hypothetical protein
LDLLRRLHKAGANRDGGEANLASRDD